MAEDTFYKKLSNFRKILNEQDWSMDGYNEKQGYPFLSHQKMKSNVSKALVASGLEWNLCYSEYSKEPEIGMMKQHYIVKATASLYSTTDTERMTMTAFGEGADSGDKAMSKAQTNALKSIISNNFLVAEIDAEGEGVESTNDSIKADSKSGFDAKVEMAKAKVMRDNPEVPKPSAVEGNVSDTQKKVLDKILNKAKVLDEGALQPFGTLEQIEADFYSIKTAEDALNFITTYQGILRCQ